MDHPAEKPRASAILVSFDGYELDEVEARLLSDGQPVAVAPRPFAMLCALARVPGALVTKQALLDAVWGHRFVTDSSIKSGISNVRAALQDDAKRPRYIETVARRGYRFIAPVRRIAAEPYLPLVEALGVMCRRDPALVELMRAIAVERGFPELPAFA